MHHEVITTFLLEPLLLFQVPQARLLRGGRGPLREPVGPRLPARLPAAGQAARRHGQERAVGGAHGHGGGVRHRGHHRAAQAGQGQGGRKRS